MEFQAILEAFRAMSPKDQLRLIGVMHDELQGKFVDPDLTPALAAEVKRRVVEYDANPAVGIPWEDVEAEIDELLQEMGE